MRVRVCVQTVVNTCTETNTVYCAFVVYLCALCSAFMPDVCAFPS